jgi:hypothetical protein
LVSFVRFDLGVVYLLRDKEELSVSLCIFVRHFTQYAPLLVVGAVSTLLGTTGVVSKNVTSVTPSLGQVGWPNHSELHCQHY